jgi:hypothetical protein
MHAITFGGSFAKLLEFSTKGGKELGGRNSRRGLYPRIRSFDLSLSHSLVLSFSSSLDLGLEVQNDSASHIETVFETTFDSFLCLPGTFSTLMPGKRIYWSVPLIVPVIQVILTIIQVVFSIFKAKILPGNCLSPKLQCLNV